MPSVSPSTPGDPSSAVLFTPELVPGIHESNVSGIPPHRAPGVALMGSVSRTPRSSYGAVGGIPWLVAVRGGA